LLTRPAAGITLGARRDGDVVVVVIIVVVVVVAGQVAPATIGVGSGVAITNRRHLNLNRSF
jgi:hypothetical protein